MSENVEKFRKIIAAYHRGEYGDRDLSLAGILEKAGEVSLIDDMSLEELHELKESKDIPIRMYAEIADKRWRKTFMEGKKRGRR